MKNRKTGFIAVSYLKDHAKTAVMFLLLCAVLLFVFFLYSFPLESVLYGFLVALVPIFIFVLVDFILYRRRYLDLLYAKDMLVAGFSEVEEKGSLIEKELASDINEMSENMRRLLSEASLKQSELIAYYTLWVHQIKTPIAAMHLILQSEKSAEGAALKQELFKIEQYVEMVLGFLRIGTMTSDLQFKTIRAHDVAKQAVKKFAATFIYKKLSVELEPFENEILTDEKWLLFVLEQLLSNALKYTSHGGIKIYMDRNDTLFIEDSGIGISQEDLPRIFERGFTGYNGRMNKTSTGLGLYLCRRILDKLGNRIEIVSDEGKGTVVKLYLHRNRLMMDD